MINIDRIPRVFFHLLVLPLIPPVAIILFILWIFRQTVRIWLLVKLGKQFGGLVASADRIYARKSKVSPQVGVSVNCLESDEPINVLEEAKSVIQTKILGRPDDYPKLLATYHSYLGQEYYLKNQLLIDDIIKPIPISPDKVFDEAYLQDFVGSIANKPFPKNNTALWEIYVATTPIKSDNGYNYPAVIKFHHIVADGMRIMIFLIEMFSAAEGNFDKYIGKVNFKKDEKKRVLEKLIMFIKNAIYFIHLLIIGPGSFLKRFLIIETSQLNALNEKPLTGEKIITWLAEEDSKGIDTVKNIKNRIPNTKFSDVISACISASFFTYFKKKNLQAPEKIICAIPILLIDPSKDIKAPIPLKNEFTIGMLDLPLVDPSKFLEGLDSVKKSMDSMRRDPLLQLLYWFISYLAGIIPQSILTKLLRGQGTTCVISSVPGVSRISCLKNTNIVWNQGVGPNLDKLGLTIAIFTYDNKFHISLLADKSVIAEKEDAQFIVKDILRNVDILNEQSLKVYK